MQEDTKRRNKITTRRACRVKQTKGEDSLIIRSQSSRRTDYSGLFSVLETVSSEQLTSVLTKNLQQSSVKYVQGPKKMLHG